MEAMRERWTDERLDDGFERVRSEIAVLRGDVGSLRQEMHEGFRSLQRTMLQLCGGIIVALIGVIATLLGPVVTQL
jgi:hypothetical protein